MLKYSWINNAVCFCDAYCASAIDVHLCDGFILLVKYDYSLGDANINIGLCWYLVGEEVTLSIYYCSNVCHINRDKVKKKLLRMDNDLAA